MRSLLSLHTFSWVPKTVGFISNYPISFLVLPRVVLVPSLNSVPFMDLLKLHALILSDFFLRFSPISLLPLCGHHFGSHCAWLILLLHHLVSTVPVLSKRSPSALSWLLLHIHLVKGTRLHHFLPPTINPGEQYRFSAAPPHPPVSVKLSFLRSPLGRMLSRAMPVSPWGDYETAVSRVRCLRLFSSTNN